MRKTWAAAILAGIMAVTGNTGIWAEELTGEAAEEAYEETVQEELDYDCLIVGQDDSSEEDVYGKEPEASAEIDKNGIETADPAVIDKDMAEAKKNIDFAEEWIPAGDFGEEALSDGEEMLLSEQEKSSADVSGLIQASLRYLAEKQTSAGAGQILPEAGVSYNKTAAHTALRSYIQSKGIPDTSSNEKYIGIKHVQNGDEYVFAVYYDPSYNTFEFYFTLTTAERSQGIVSMRVPFGMPDEVEVYVGEYKDYTDSEPYGVSRTILSSPATYRGSETLAFTIGDGSYVGSSYAEVQTFSNHLLQAGFGGWNELVGEAYESMQSLGFASYGTSAVTTLTRPVITGYYNSVKGADLRWGRVPNASGYYIYRNRAAEGGNKLIATIPDGNTTQYYDEAIKSNCWGRVYSYTVVAFNGNVKSPVSIAATLQRLAPMKFTGFQRPASGTIMLRWECTESSNKALGYEVQYAQSTHDLSNRTGTFGKISLSGRNSLIGTIKGLKSNTKYYFRVRSYVNYTHSVTKKTTKTWSQYSTVVAVTTR